MSTPAVIMRASAALLNDAAQTNFTNEAMLPYLNMAWKELREFCQQHNYGITNKVSTQVVIPAGTTVVGDPSGVSLPGDLLEIRELYERQDGTTDDFIPMTRVEFLPPTQVITAWLTWWTWNGQKIEFIGATQDQQLRIDYIADIFTDIQLNQLEINLPLINSHSFLQYRTAALVARFVGENESRSEELNVTAQLAVDRFAAINTKGRQAIATRRRPFMMAYKTNSNYGV